MSLHGARILVVEDAPDIRNVFTLLLEAEGAEVTATGAGCEAVEIASGREFDILITDLGLPDIPGDLVIRLIRAAARRHPTVFVVTGYGEPFVSRARQAGANVVFIKPIVWSELLDQLMRAAPRAA